MLQRPDDRFSVGVKQGFPVGTVIEEKFFTLVAGTKVTSQQRQDPVFRFDLPAQHAAQVGKADKALQQVDPAVEVADRYSSLSGRQVRKPLCSSSAV